ncbi:hypothetical protein PLCT1_01176 [Planctomycetaceae bacterium]|nr:hypothetical protein PLCT1_01176 [Planctomycetaceae bacterium]
MRFTVLAVLGFLVFASDCAAQTVTRAWNQQVMSGVGDYGSFQMGYEFEVLSGTELPEVVELGAALPIQSGGAVPGYTYSVTKAKVSLWELNSTGSSGTKIATAEVNAVATWAWATLTTPVVLTPGKHYRVTVLTKVIQTWTPTGGGTPINNEANDIYFYHSSGLTPLTQPTGPIKFIDGCSGDNGTWPATADENTFPSDVGAGQPWGMADIGWRRAEAAPVLGAPTVQKNVSGVLITEAGPDVATGGLEGGELQNVSDRWIDVSGYRIAIYDGSEAQSQSQSVQTPVAIGTIPAGTSLAPGQIFTFGESGTSTAFALSFGNWNWTTSSLSAVVLLDAADNVLDVLKINNFDISLVTNPVAIPATEWTGSYMSSWSTTQTWQRNGGSDTNTTSGWVRTTPSFGNTNTQISLPYANAGARYAVLGGTDPAFTGQLTVGDKLAISFSATDMNTSDNLNLTVTAISGMDPATAGFSGLTATTPVNATSAGSVNLALSGTAAQAGTLTLRITVTDPTSRTDTYTYALTINAAPNFAPAFNVSYDIGSGRQTINSGANFGTAAQPVQFGTALSAYAFQVKLLDGNSDSVSVSASLVLNPTSAQQGMVAADWAHAAQAATYMYSPNGNALFAHLNALQCTFTLTLTASDGKGGTRDFVITFLVAARPANSAPAISVTQNGATVAQNGNVLVAPNATLASLALQISVNDANNDPVRLIGSVSNVTTQGINATEFSSGGYLSVSYNLTPASGVFNQAAIVHQITLTADDTKWLGVSVFTFNIVVNRAPTLSVTAASVPVTSGGTIAANYLDTLASLALAINVNDPDADPTAVSATVTGVTTQGFSAADFSAAQAGVAYVIVPANGAFNDVAGSSHLVTLTATDQWGVSTVFTFTLSANSFSPALEVREQGGAAIANGALPAAGRLFGTRDVNAGPSAALVIELANIGSGPLGVQSVSMSGPNAADFVVGAASLPASVLPTAPYTFTVSFDPTSNGLKQATVNISYTTTGGPLTFAFAVLGTGQDAAGVRILTNSLPGALTDSPYAPTQLGVTGGTPGYTWSLFAGQLPSGLTLDAQGNLAGIIDIAAQTGVYTFTVRVEDAAGGTDEKQLQIDVTTNPVSLVGSGGGSGGGGCQSGENAGAAALIMLALLACGALLRRRMA